MFKRIGISNILKKTEFCPTDKSPFFVNESAQRERVLLQRVGGM